MAEPHFPNESEEYRRARNELLEAEKDLRRKVEEVAAKRRKLPLGGKIPEDYVFDSAEGKTKLSDLFTCSWGDKQHTTLILYSYMFGPPMENPCPSCTSILDGLDGQVKHITERAAFAVVVKTTVEKVRGFAEKRGWRNFRFLSSANNSFNRDYHAEREGGGQNPLLHVFVKDKASGEIRHFWTSELLFPQPEPNQDPRHVDPIWPLWNVLDTTPEGRGEFHPKLSYEK
jgi:predicted dithiol-disulfide oxidoreductase (DUF899 family)